MKAGDCFNRTHGEYSNYEIVNQYRCLKDFTIAGIFDEIKECLGFDLERLGDKERGVHPRWADIQITDYANDRRSRFFWKYLKSKGYIEELPEFKEINQDGYSSGILEETP